MQKYLVEGCNCYEARLMLSRQLDILIDSCINILDTHMSNCTTTAEEPI